MRIKLNLRKTIIGDQGLLGICEGMKNIEGLRTLQLNLKYIKFNKITILLQNF